MALDVLRSIHGDVKRGQELEHLLVVSLRLPHQNSLILSHDVRPRSGGIYSSRSHGLGGDTPLVLEPGLKESVLDYAHFTRRGKIRRHLYRLVHLIGRHLPLNKRPYGEVLDNQVTLKLRLVDGSWWLHDLPRKSLGVLESRFRLNGHL